MLDIFLGVLVVCTNPPVYITGRRCDNLTNPVPPANCRAAPADVRMQEEGGLGGEREGEREKEREREDQTDIIILDSKG